MTTKRFDDRCDLGGKRGPVATWPGRRFILADRSFCIATGKQSWAHTVKLDGVGR